MWSGREVRGWGLGCRDKEGLLGTIRGVVAPWPCAEHIYIDFRAWDWHLGAVRRPPACCYVLCLFNFGSFSSFARPIHFFFYIVFCGCTINWAEIASAKLTVSCTLIDFCSGPGTPTLPTSLRGLGKSACGRGFGQSGAVGSLCWGFLIMAKRAFAVA